VFETLTTKTTVNLPSRCGGNLIDLRLAPEAVAEATAHARELPSIQLSERALCDIELLACGAFSPLDRFMGLSDYQRVLGEMRLAPTSYFPFQLR